VKELGEMRGRPIVPVIHVSPVEERPVELLKIDRRVRFPTCFVKVVVQDDDSTSRLRGLLHVDNRALRLADPLDCPGGGYDVEPIVEPVAERQNIRALKAQVSHSAILLNGDCQVGIVAIDTQRHTVRAHCFCDISGDRSRAATNIEDVHSGAQDSRKIGMIPLQSASIKDPWIGAVRLLAHLPSFMIP